MSDSEGENPEEPAGSGESSTETESNPETNTETGASSGAESSTDTSPPSDWSEEDGSNGGDGPPSDWSEEENDEDETEDDEPEDESLGDPEYANVEDLGLTRDGKADRTPVDHEIENVGMGRFIPLNYGDAESYFGEDEVSEADAKTIAKVWRNHVERPDVAAQTGIGRVRQSTIKNMSPMVPANTLEALMKVSGIDADVEVDDDGNATVDMSDEQGN